MPDSLADWICWVGGRQLTGPGDQMKRGEKYQVKELRRRGRVERSKFAAPAQYPDATLERAIRSNEGF